MKKGMRKGIALLLSAAMIISVPLIPGKTVQDVKAADEYTLVWEDEFNGTELNREKWRVEVNGNGGGNDERQYYVDNKENIQVSDGTLKLIAKKQNYNGKQYTSGRINTNGLAQFKYGKVEARIKMPCFNGIWPAFWMLGASYNDVGWPRCGEIDIMEAINAEQRTYGTVHWNCEDIPNADQHAEYGTNSSSVLGADFDRTQWHTYGIIWDKNFIRFYVDDKIFLTQGISVSHMSEFREEQFIILNMAVGGRWPGFDIDDSQMPATMEVDYVKVYQRDSDEGSYSGTSFDEEDSEVETKFEPQKDVLTELGAWGFFFGTDAWAEAQGTGTSTDSKGFTLNIDKVGHDPWGIQSSIKGLQFTKGNKYKYSFTMQSSVDKRVIVKVVGNNSESDIFSMDYIDLRANEPYRYSKEIEIPSYYKGRLDLFFGYGGGVNGEAINQNTSAIITANDFSFIGDVVTPITTKPVTKPTTKPTEKQTEKSTVTMKPEEVTSTNRVETDGEQAGNINQNNGGSNGQNNQESTNPAITNADEISIEIGSMQKKKAKIKYAKRYKKRSAKIAIRKQKYAKSYTVKYSTSKKFFGYETKKIKKNKFTFKKLERNSTYYFKVRACIIYNGKKYYSKWSKKKKVKIK